MGAGWPGAPRSWPLRGTAVGSRWRAQAGLSAGGVAGRLEELGAWRRGTLTALLDHARRPAPAATLLALADRAQADDVARRGAAAAEPLARPVRSLGLAGAGVLALGLAAFGSAGPVHGPAAALWHPRRAWDATVAPVRIRARPRDRGPRRFDRARSWRRSAAGRRRSGSARRAKAGGRAACGSIRSGARSVTTGPLQSDVFARLTSGRRALGHA